MKVRQPFLKPAALLVFVAAGLVGRPGRASETLAEESRVGVRLELSAGIAVLDSLSAPPSTPNDEIGDVGASFGGALDVRVGHVLVGGNADVVVTFNQSETFVGGHAGLLQNDATSEFAVMAEGGAHTFHNLGSGLLTESDDPSATLPYAGLKVGMVHKSSAGYVNPGFWLFARGDLARRTVVAHTRAFTDHTDIAYDVGGLSFGFAFCVQLGH